MVTILQWLILHTVNGPFSLAVLLYQRVAVGFFMVDFFLVLCHEKWLESGTKWTF